MSTTRLNTTQARFQSQYTGDHVLDDYMEEAERGGRSLPDLMAELFDEMGVLSAFDFRFNPSGTDYQFQYRIGTGAWTPAVDFSSFYTSIQASAAAAAADAASAAASLDNFTDIWLGAYAADPTLDNDGDPLTAGDAYFNTSSNVLKVYTGSAWQTIDLAPIDTVFGRTGAIVALNGDVDGITIDMQDEQLSQATLKDTGYLEYNLGTTSGSITFNNVNGNAQAVVLNGNVTSVTLSNWPPSGVRGTLTLRIDQDGSGGRTITGWPVAVSWFGRAPSLSGRTASARDVIVLTTSDGGTSIEGYWMTDDAIIAGTL